MKSNKSRLAPSPTGALHIGNAFAFVINWALAKKKQWELLFRMEDLDGPRKKLETIQESIDILIWLGLTWDGPVHIQSDDLSQCKHALEELIRQDNAYHCCLSRAEIEESSLAPHTKLALHDGSIRPVDISKHNASHDNSHSNWRFCSSGNSRTIKDTLSGNMEFKVTDDFVIWTKSNMPSYQLAVIVDDHRQGITDVVRGKDLLQSAAWQEELYEALGWEAPRWWHLPLIVGPDGKRLAKRHGDSRISSYKTQGVSSERIIGLIANWCGVSTTLEPMSLDSFLQHFTLMHLPTTNITFSQKEELWLRG
ncbi:MAG: tRNA glutamyl-Q(34) synthetase GluQRS [Phycisphaerae bacterium]|nr:tRNA glutamyl-Q(34) synthetase GluQRS [Phycisphaerae bacterium]MBT6269194.1 tRNA glutamyl-Q(34) synthetase GluQRS [Phycisphaerae bacterium]